MECLLAVCLYAEIALGHSANMDTKAYLHGRAVVAEERLDRPGPIGRFALGADKTWGRWTVFGELRHESSVVTEADSGTDGAWIGARVRF